MKRRTQIKDVARRVPRVLVNSLVLFLSMQVFGLLAPSRSVFEILYPAQGYTLQRAVLLTLLIIELFLAVRIIVDTIRILDVVVGLFTELFPGLKPSGHASLFRAFKELLYVLVIVLAATFILPLAEAVPEIGQYLSLIVLAVSIGASVALSYDAGRVLYGALQGGIDLLVEKIPGVKTEGDSNQEKELRSLQGA